MSIEIVLIHFALGLALFFIINWIGKHSYSYGYMSISMFVREDEAPAFNFIIRILSPVIYLFIAASVLYSLNLDQYVHKFYFVCLYYIIIRLVINLLTERALLINWPRQFLYWFCIMFLSYYAYEKIIVTKKNLLPDFSNLSNELWIVIILFLYQTFNRLELSNKGTYRRKDNYMKSRYLYFKNKFGEIVDTLENERLIAIAYSILIYENFNRPRVIRIIERISFLITGEPHTLGVMQVHSKALIDDKESVRLGVAKIQDVYNRIVESPKEHYFGDWQEPDYYIKRDIVEDYNGGVDYTEAVLELNKFIEENFFRNSRYKLTDGIKDKPAPPES